jgi:hypothetical protein
MKFGARSSHETKQHSLAGLGDTLSATGDAQLSSWLDDDGLTTMAVRLVYGEGRVGEDDNWTTSPAMMRIATH